MNQTSTPSQQVPGLNLQENQSQSAASGTTGAPTSTAQSAANFKQVKKNPFTPQVIIGIIILIMVVIGAIAGFYLTQVNQDVRQQAYEDEDGGGYATPPPAPKCSDYFTESLCSGSSLGCDWTPPANPSSEGYCRDQATTPNTGCSSRSGNKADCEGPSDSCVYNDSTGVCSIGAPTPVTPAPTGCASFSESVCRQLNSCHWTGTACAEGAPGSCTSFSQSVCEQLDSCSWSVSTQTCQNGPGPTPAGCSSFSQSVCQQLNSCHWTGTTCANGPAPTPVPGGTGCASLSENACNLSTSCNWDNGACKVTSTTCIDPAIQACADGYRIINVPQGQCISGKRCVEDTGTGGPSPSPVLGCAQYNNSAPQCFQNGCEYSFSTSTCNVATPNPTEGCGQYNGDPQLCVNNFCSFDTDTLICSDAIICTNYHGKEAECESHSQCDYEGGFCQAAGQGGPTYGNPGKCADINGNLTDAVCYACPGTIDPSGGCQQNPVTISQPGNVPNASSMSMRVNNCGIVQCDCKGTGAGSGYAIPLVFTSQVFTGSCSNTVTKYACVNGTCQATTGSGYGTMPMCEANCGAPTPAPTTPPGGTPVPTPPPTVPPVTYQCNSRCETDAQCKTSDNRFTCENTSNGKRCRLASNPTSAQCQGIPGPQCLSITMSNVNRPNSPVNTEPFIGEAVRFTCGQVAAAQRYIFRIFGPTGEPTVLESTGNISEPFNILTNGPYSAQCQICTGQADSTCLPFEEP